MMRKFKEWIGSTLIPWCAIMMVLAILFLGLMIMILKFIVLVDVVRNLF